MVYLVDGLVLEQDGFVVGSDETGCEGTLAVLHSAALDGEAGLDAVFDLRGRGGGAGWEEGGLEGFGGL